MALKVQSDIDESLFLNETLYDEEKMEAYCQKHHISKDQLSEDEKNAFRLATITLSFATDDVQ